MQAADPAQLVARYGSPLYVYDADTVRRAFADLRSAFSYEAAEYHYAIVCNKNRYLVEMIHRLGVGIHANTPGDAHAALTAGVPAERIVYSGTNLSANDFDYLLSAGIALNLDSLDQLRALAARRPCAETAVGLRLLIDDEDLPNRIGVSPAELPTALEIARSTNVRLAGLHMYAGTNTQKSSRFLVCLQRLMEAAELLPDLDYLDLGGGFGVAYKQSRPALDLAQLGREVSERMSEFSERRRKRIRLLIEPGRTLVAEAGVLLMTVLTVKERGGRRYIGVDTTVGNIVVESVYHSFHRIEALAARGESLAIPTAVCGNTTHSRDYISRSCRLPEVRPGDLLVLRDVGAYGYAMSSHFLNRPRPAEVVIDGGAVCLTTRRETLDDLLATQLDVCTVSAPPSTPVDA